MIVTRFNWATIKQIYNHAADPEIVKVYYSKVITIGKKQFPTKFTHQVKRQDLNTNDFSRILSSEHYLS